MYTVVRPIVRSLLTAILPCVIAWSSSQAAERLDCRGLAVRPPASDEQFSGRIDGSLQGFLGPRLGSASADGEYAKAVQDTLATYPQAPVLFVVERLILLRCEALAKSKLSD